MKRAYVKDILQGEAIEVRGWHLDAEVNAVLIERPSSFAAHSLMGTIHQVDQGTIEIESIEIGEIYVVNESGDMINVDKTLQQFIKHAFKVEVEKLILDNASDATWLEEED